MAKKEFTYRGKTQSELAALSLKEFIELLPSRQRRSLTRGFSHRQKVLLENLKNNKKTVRTHARNLVILPQMIGKIVGVYNGKEYIPVAVVPEMLGHVLGEFSPTRKRIQHSAPGVGATKSSSGVSVR